MTKLIVGLESLRNATIQLQRGGLWELGESTPERNLKVGAIQIIAVFTRVGAAGFSTIFFDRSYIFAHALLDIQHLNDSTDALDFYSILMALLKAFDQH